MLRDGLISTRKSKSPAGAAAVSQWEKPKVVGARVMDIQFYLEVFRKSCNIEHMQSKIMLYEIFKCMAV